MDSIATLIATLGKNARTAAKTLRSASTQYKNNALNNIATQVDKNRKDILNANQKDLNQGKSSGLDAALLDRLMLDDARLDGIIESLNQIATLPDPVGEITDLKFRPSGIQVGKMRVPLGVMGIIYESRPNVTIDAAALCLKSGNGAILRGVNYRHLGTITNGFNQAFATAWNDGIYEIRGFNQFSNGCTVGGVD
jgi:glutamate-5-semialdehyde dehydrogenase